MRTAEHSDYDFYLFHQGTNYHAYELFGAHSAVENGHAGVRFAVWAPRAAAVSVVGDFNGWETGKDRMARQADGETWELFIAGLPAGSLYKYAVEGADGRTVLKSDPYAFRAECPPDTASVVYEPHYEWQDGDWQARKKQGRSYEQPMLIYEVHAGSWRRTAAGGVLSYRELADRLVSYVQQMHYTHIEFLPLCEHPFDGSWGYQITGYYAATSRYGRPEDLMYLIDRAHQSGIGVILDWVPGHFCNDEHGLRQFDGANLYETDDRLRADNPEWGTTNFDYGRTEVQSFLISNALFWLEEYHADGLRIDAVANMLYLNYARRDGEWQPNKYGGTGNLEAIEFIQKLNTAVFHYHPEVLMLAEESTAWPLVTRPADAGGLGFNYKWNMGWMNDILDYISTDPLFRKGKHDKLTFSFMYAFSENFVLPLSHDEVVHGKRSLLSRQPGDYWQKFAGLRCFFGYWIAHPGKKLLFMGGEFGQFIEWKYDDGLDWQLPEQYPMHRSLLEYSAALNAFYVSRPELWQIDFSWEGFEWVDCSDTGNSIITFLRRAREPGRFLEVVCNFTPQTIAGYRIGVPESGEYQEVFNSDAAEFGGSGVQNSGAVFSADIPWHGKEHSLVLTVPPLAVVYLERVRPLPADAGNGVRQRKRPARVVAGGRRRSGRIKRRRAAEIAGDAIKEDDIK